MMVLLCLAMSSSASSLGINCVFVLAMGKATSKYVTVLAQNFS